MTSPYFGKRRRIRLTSTDYADREATGTRFFMRRHRLWPMDPTAPRDPNIPRDSNNPFYPYRDPAELTCLTSFTARGASSFAGEAVGFSRVAPRVTGTSIPPPLAPAGRGIRRDVVTAVHDMPLYAPVGASPPEMKLYTKSVSFTPSLLVPQLFPLNDIVSGTSVFTRNGARISMVHLQLRGQLKSVLFIPNAPVWLTVIYDRSPGGAGSPPINAIYEGLDHRAFAIADRSERYEELARYQYMITETTSCQVLDVHLDFTRDSVFSGVFGTIQIGALYLIAFSDASVGNTVIDVATRLAFVDP